MAAQLQLKQELNGLQIFFIVFSAVIGSGVFIGNGEALAVAGPAGMIGIVVILGLIAAMVVETVGQFVQLFPAPNAIYEYIWAFLDEELAGVVAIAYWYCYSAVFANQMLQIAKLLCYWQETMKTSTDGLAVWLSYGFVPVFLFLINLSGVKVFGWIETIGGLIKLVILVAFTILLYVIAGQASHKTYLDPIVETTEKDPQHPLYAGNWNIALCIAFPGVAYGYIGVESIIMAAFEASPKSDKKFFDLAWASRWAHWVIVSLYFLYTLGVALTVHWLDPRLSTVYGIDPLNVTAMNINYNLGKVAGFVHDYYTNSTIIIAMQSDDGSNEHPRNLPSVSFVNVCLIFCVMSAANTSLYIASRTLWGIARHAVRGRSPLSRLVKRLSGIWESTSVPGISLIASLVAILSWYPGVQFAAAAKDVSKIDQIVSYTASVCCLIVWAALCLTYIRTSECKDHLESVYLGDFIPDLHRNQKRTGNYFNRSIPFLRVPFGAFAGLIGSRECLRCRNID
ncbi:hypothetical protein E8E14_000267 [Neopestalotiopsis sp. 37M]|nr:hypothetical protein E8E14_000267 [Neopestalotiopsis sp. 37M]